MNTLQTDRKVENVTLPPEVDGFRVGDAHATVDGQPVRLFTSRPATSSFSAHRRDMEIIFGLGVGLPASGWHSTC